MVRQFIALVIATIVFFGHVESDRVRRQSGNSDPNRIARQSPPTPIPCAVKCTWSFAQAWAKTVGFEIPTANMVPRNLLTGNDNIYNLLCGLYDLTQICVRGCAAANDANDAMRLALLHSDPVCNRTATEFAKEMPCISQNAATFRRTCAKESEELLAASIRLTTQAKIDPVLPRQFCKAANLQAYCVFPILRQTCGDMASDSIRQLANASLYFVQASVDNDLISAFYPECGEYFRTIRDGVLSAADRKNSTFPTIETNLIWEIQNATNSTNSTILDRAGALPLDNPTTRSSNEGNLSLASSILVFMFALFLVCPFSI